MTSGDVFVLHPKDNPDKCFELTGEELTLLYHCAQVHSQGELDALLDRLSEYFEGLK